MRKIPTQFISQQASVGVDLVEESTFCVGIEKIHFYFGSRKTPMKRHSKNFHSKIISI